MVPNWETSDERGYILIKLDITGSQAKGGKDVSNMK